MEKMPLITRQTGINEYDIGYNIGSSFQLDADQLVFEEWKQKEAEWLEKWWRHHQEGIVQMDMDTHIAKLRNG
jgi:hypothetical protein